ncbi:MAG: lamin tail domain-containing protein [Acholeplasmataceae bacterium]|nr:lamin tail domain-containing protein [Acholeplasmataceae bacterium]
MKSKRFNLSKVLLTFMFVLLSAVVLVACGDSDQDLVDQALETVAVTFSSGDTQDSVTKNLILPETIGEIQVSWASSNPAVISNAGVVTRPATDTEVTLTATLTLGDVSETYSVTVTVIAAVVVIDPMDALDAIVITGTTLEMVGSVYETTTNIVLPATALGLNVTWTTSNADYVAVDGTVVRPNFGIANQVVTLTATIGGEEKTFLIKVLAFTEKPVSQILDEAKTALLLDGISGGVATDITLPATVGAEGVTVTWSSDNTAVIADDGTVTRPAMGLDDVTVILTATLTKDTQSVTKDFSVLVLANVEPTLFTSISDILTNAVKDDFVKVENVTVVGLTADSYLFADSTGILAVYYGSAPTVTVGMVYDIYGIFDVYNGSPQLNNTTDSTMPAVATPSEGDVTVLTPTIVDDVDAYVQNDAPTYGPSNLFTYEYVQVTAKVRIQGDGNYDTFFVNTDYSGSDINSASNSPHTDNAIMIYYRSNKAAFNAFDDKVVSFNAFMFSYRSDRTIYTLVFTGEVEDITFIASDAEAVEMAKDELAPMFEYEYIEAETLTLPVLSEQGATIAWASDSLLVDVATGALTLPVTGQEDVTLTATITKGTEVGTFTVVLTVGELPNSTILEAVQLGTGHLVEITGIITSAEYQNTYFIQDETAGIAIYTSWGDLETFLQANYGKEVTLIGERAVYNGLIQLSSIKDGYTLVGDPVAPIAAVNVDEHNLDSDSLEPFQGQLVEMTGLIVVGVDSDSYGNTYIDLLNMVSGIQMTMKQDSRVTLSTEAAALLATLAVGDVVTITNPLAWNKGPYLYFTDTTMITESVLSDAAAVAATKATLMVEVDQPVIADETLTLLDAYLGTAITWASDDTAVITDAGAIMVPADMKQVTVTLTATITKGTETETKAFEILVGNIVPISAAIDAELEDVVIVQGVVTSDAYYRTYFVQDATGGIAVYTSDSAMQAIFEANVGMEVKVTGARAVYNGLRQISPTEVVALTTGTLPAATNVDAVLLNDDMLVNQGLLVELTNLLVTDVYVDGYSNISVTLSRPAEGNSVVMKFDSRATLSTEAQTALEAIVVGDVLNVTANMAWANGPFLYYTNTTLLSVGTLSDADKAAAAAQEIELVEAITEAGTLVLPATGDYSSTIVWTSSNDALINASTGAVVLPAEFTETVTLTATVTVNGVEAVATFEISVGVPSTVYGATDLFFSEYIEGGSNNKALEIFNGTGADVDLSLYTVNQYSNGATTPNNTVTLTGTLLNGDVYVIYNSGSVQAILDEGDLAASVTYFNGDDAVELVKSGVVIDVIGLVGEDPGSEWTAGDGSTANHTIVRAESVTGPNAVYTPTEWVSYAQDTFDYIGAHTMVLPVVMDLFISEYIEGSGSNKALELYNPTMDTLDLTVYSLELYSNGGTEASVTYTLTGTLAAGEVFIIANASAVQAILDLADVAQSYPSVPNWNGDDCVVLKKDGVIIDIILSIGHTNNQNDAADVTWVRNANVVGPNATFNLAEWTEYPQDTLTYLGTHTVS